MRQTNEFFETRLASLDGGGSVSDATTTSGGGGNACAKCGTRLHSGGRSRCPWKAKSDKDARKCGSRALLELGKVDQDSLREAGEGGDEL